MGTKSLKKGGLGFGPENNSDEKHNEMKANLMNHVKKLFLPELLNRIDESIVFHALSEQNVFEIIDLQLSDLIQNLEKLGLKLKISKSAKKLIAKKGYDSEFGVRPLRREIQCSLEDPISEMLLRQVFNKGTVIKIGALKNQLTFNYQQQKSSKRKTTKLSSK